jgi:hypothetical protein
LLATTWRENEEEDLPEDLKAGNPCGTVPMKVDAEMELKEVAMIAACVSVCVCALCLFAFAHCALSSVLFSLACAALLSLGGQQWRLAKQFFRHLEWRLMTAHLWDVNERPCFIPGLYLKSLTMTTGFRPSCGQL